MFNVQGVVSGLDHIRKEEDAVEDKKVRGTSATIASASLRTYDSCTGEGSSVWAEIVRNVVALGTT